MKIKSKSTRASIQLDGQFGSFYIGEKKFVVNYFSTFASPVDSEGGHAQLLKELAPMREKVVASEMKSLDALLQRDLSDERIATELIPYLEGKFSKVGFFPAVLTVLIPKGFIQGKRGISYPEVTKNCRVSKFGAHWDLELYPTQDADGNELDSRLGRLTIYLGETDIIVIDGQHRSNAFRYVADCFEVKDAYKPFYSGVEKFQGYTSDLPVTIIWFEANGGEKVEPTDISRELFVAVNNSAKRVSESRTVLLDEVNVTSLAVNTYYNYLAENTKFNSKGISLLTSGFDTSSESIKPPLAITDPGKVDYAFRYAFFGNSKYNKICERAERHKQNNEERFIRIFGKSDFYEHPESGVFRITSVLKRADFRLQFLRIYKPVLDLLFSEDLFLKPHYSAIADIEKWLDHEETTAPHKTMWETVFCGGEGLYHAYMISKIPKCKSESKYIRAIDKQFVSMRYKNVVKMGCSGILEKSVNAAYRTFDTQAFQTAFFMFFDFIYREFYEKNKIDLASTDLTKILASVKQKTWLHFFVEYKRAVIGESIDPNHWPLFQKMLLRLVDSSYSQIFDRMDSYPDWNILSLFIDERIGNYVGSNGFSPEGDDLVTIQVEAREYLKSVNKLVSLKNVADPLVYKMIDSATVSALKKHSI